jgi:hypothetical protein
MEILISFLKTLNTLSLLAVIALLDTVIYLLVKGKTAADSKVETIATNHLHDFRRSPSRSRRCLEPCGASSSEWAKKSPT